MSTRGNGGAARFGLLLYDANCGDEMLVLMAFLYLALPVLSSGATGLLAGMRMAHVGAVRGLSVGIALSLIAIVANIGYAFLWDAFYQWQYPPVVYLSETRAISYDYTNQQEREIAFLVGPVIVAGLFATGAWLGCWRRSRRHTNGSPR